MNRYLPWFRRIMLLGIAQDLALGLPGMFKPDFVLSLAKQRPTDDPMWAAFASLALVLLALMYIPGALNPFRYKVAAWLSVFARPPGILFFFFLYPGLYNIFGWIDLVLFSLQFVLLFLTMKAGPDRDWRAGTLRPNDKDEDIEEYDGSTFEEVKRISLGGAYPEGEPLPLHSGLGAAPSTFLRFLNDSSRNMHDHRDIRPRYNKLIHSNGVCYAGTWKITADSPYTGYLSTGSEGLLIARMSVAGPQIMSNQRRGIGIAGKVWPTMDPNERHWPANFVTVTHLSGLKSKHITDMEPLNFPTVGWDPAANMINRVFFRLMDTRPGYRQLFPISTLGLSPDDPVVTPDLVKFTIAPGMPRIDAMDFRDELRLEHYPDNTLKYVINVRNFDTETWTQLGEIAFTEYAIGEGGDKRIHFWIPRDVQADTASA